MENPDMIACSNCKCSVSCRHSWIGDNKLQYCRTCAPQFRFDMLPIGPTLEWQHTVYSKAAEMLESTISEVKLMFSWYDVCRFVKYN